MISEIFLVQVKSKVEGFKTHMPIVMTLFNPGMRERHWEQISEIAKIRLRPDDDMSLSRLIEYDLDPSLFPQFEGVSEAAGKEYSLEKALDKMKSEWAPVSALTFRFLSAVYYAFHIVKRNVQEDFLLRYIS